MGCHLWATALATYKLSLTATPIWRPVQVGAPLLLGNVRRATPVQQVADRKIKFIFFVVVFKDGLNAFNTVGCENTDNK